MPAIPTRQLVLCLFFFMGFVPFSQAAEVSKVNSKKKVAILNLTSDEAAALAKGDEGFAMKGSKKKGLLQITKVKGTKAMANILKGRAEKGDEVLFDIGTSAASSSGSGSRKGKMSIGALLGYGMDAQTVKSSNGTANLKGSGLSFKGFFDYRILKSVSARLEVGMEQFKASTDINGTKPKTEINFLEVNLTGNFYIVDSATKFYVGGGVSLLSPMSQSVTAVEPVSTTTAFNGKVGASFAIGKKYFIPMQFDYLYFPPSATVTTSIMAGRIGIGMNL